MVFVFLLQVIACDQKHLMPFTDNIPLNVTFNNVLSFAVYFCFVPTFLLTVLCNTGWLFHFGSPKNPYISTANRLESNDISLFFSSTIYKKFEYVSLKKMTDYIAVYKHNQLFCWTLKNIYGETFNTLFDKYFKWPFFQWK